MANDTEIAAEDIAEALLAITGDALMAGDFDAFASAFHLRQTMATIGGPIHVEVKDDLRRGFEEVVRYYKAIGVTDMVRSVAAADYKSTGVIESTHICDLLHNGKRLKETYPVFSVLKKNQRRLADH